MSEIKNARQIPKSKEICSSKLYNDILYGYLQVISKWDGEIGHPRYVEKREINFTALAGKLKLSRQTVSTKFKALEKMGLIKFNKDKYELIILDKKIATLLPQRTIELLVNTLNQQTISTFVYLCMRYLANNEQSYVFTLTQVKSFLGICETTRSNDNVITDILFVLQKLGFIKYSLTSIENDSGDIKTAYQVDSIQPCITC